MTQRPAIGTVRIATELQPFADAEGASWPAGQDAQFYFFSEGIPAGQGIEALIPLVSHPIGAAELDRLPDLKVVANYGVGYDNVDIAAADERGVTVTNTPGVLTEATADLTLALILGTARRLREGLETARSGSSGCESITGADGLTPGLRVVWGRSGEKAWKTC